MRRLALTGSLLLALYAVSFAWGAAAASAASTATDVAALNVCLQTQADSMRAQPDAGTIFVTGCTYFDDLGSGSPGYDVTASECSTCATAADATAALVAYYGADANVWQVLGQRAVGTNTAWFVVTNPGAELHAADSTTTTTTDPDADWTAVGGVDALDWGATATGSSVVALSADDQTRLDYVWWGMWAAVGLLLVLIAAPLYTRAFRFWEEA